MTLSHHSFATSKDVVKCCACLATTGLNSPAIWARINSECHPAIKQRINQPINIPEPLVIGNRASHSSHNLYPYKGIQYCGACGFMALKLMRSVVLECKGTQGRTLHGQRVLDVIKDNICPIVGQAWPEDP